jgi:hypothetical protein
MRTSFQSIFTTLRAKRVRRWPFGLCKLAAVLRRPNGMRSTVWSQKHPPSSSSFLQHQSTCGRHAVFIGDHKLCICGGSSEFNWDAIESALTSKCLRVTQQNKTNHSRSHSSGSIHSSAGYFSSNFQLGLADLVRSAAQLPTTGSGRPHCAGASACDTRSRGACRRHCAAASTSTCFKACAINLIFGIWP